MLHNNVNVNSGLRVLEPQEIEVVSGGLWIDNPTIDGSTTNPTGFEDPNMFGGLGRWLADTVGKWGVGAFLDSLVGGDGGSSKYESNEKVIGQNFDPSQVREYDADNNVWYMNNGDVFVDRDGNGYADQRATLGSDGNVYVDNGDGKGFGR